MSMYPWKRVRFLPLVALLAACSGKDGDGTDVTGDDDDATTSPVECSVPDYGDLNTLSCDQLASAWHATVEAGNECRSASDCIVLRAECEHWYQIDCFHAVNQDCVSAQDMADFNAAASACATGGDSCICSGETPVDCVDGECVITQAQ